MRYVGVQTTVEGHQMPSPPRPDDSLPPSPRPPKYKIVCMAAYPEQADTYLVIYVPSGEVLSQHESWAEARAVVRRQESADVKRRYLKDLP